MKILFAGDFCISECTPYTLDTIFGNVLTELHDKDISIVNLECPLTKRNTPINKTGPNVKAPPKTVECVKASGFDIVSLANNHIADYNSVAVNDTIQLLKSNNIKYVGAGLSLSEAQKTLRVQINDKVIKFLAFAENEFNCADEKTAGAWPLDPVTNILQIKKRLKTE